MDELISNFVGGFIIGIVIRQWILRQPAKEKAVAAPPAPNLIDTWKTGWQRSQDNPSRLVRWLESMPGGRTWRQQRGLSYWQAFWPPNYWLKPLADKEEAA